MSPVDRSHPVGIREELRLLAAGGAAAGPVAAWDVEAALPWRLDKKMQRVEMR